MYEPGEPSNSLQQMGIHRTELEGTGGKTVLIYTEEKMTIIVPDSVDFKSLDIIAKTKDITLTSDDITVNCKNLTVNATKVTINADLDVHGVVNLN